MVGKRKWFEPLTALDVTLWTPMFTTVALVVCKKYDELSDHSLMESELDCVCVCVCVYIKKEKNNLRSSWDLTRIFQTLVECTN